MGAPVTKTAVIARPRIADAAAELRSGLKGDARIDRGHGGDLYYTVAGPSTARPLVLLHGFYPAEPVMSMSALRRGSRVTSASMPSTGWALACRSTPRWPTPANSTRRF